MQNVGPVQSSFGLDYLGLKNLNTVHWNLPAAALVADAVKKGEAVLGKGGALLADTGEHTGRSANDRFVVKDATSENVVDWGKVNKPISSAAFDRLYDKVVQFYEGRDAFIQDLWAGANETYRLPVRMINQKSWHNMFVRNMFIEPTVDERKDFTPEFTVLQAPDFLAEGEDELNSEVFILVNFTKKVVLIGGTSYAGENKKSIFSVLNLILPLKGVLPMHCSANIGADGNSAIFFGLSGTGKTTLSADKSRTLIGDDEHGWCDEGVFNFEGGCYAKVIKLEEEAEPEIFATTAMFGTVLENVVYDPDTLELDLDDASKTENTRASYPLASIPNASATGQGPHPKDIIMLTCDAFGVLPPISKLSSAQAMYHFLSGYTAKVAGTEKGVTEPTAAFSACFGAPFMPLHPTTYAEILGKMMEEHGVDCWLVNTGWSGGAYGTGSRMKIKYTRAMVNAALDGVLAKGSFQVEPFFGLEIPTALAGVPAEVLNPKESWEDGAAYDAQAQKLVAMFEANFKQYEEHVTADVIEQAIKAA